MKKKKRRLLSNLILVVALATFSYSVYQVYLIHTEYQKGESEYEAIAEDVITEEVAEDVKNDNSETPEIVFKVDFDKLRAVNEDTVAWIRFEQPEKISYPIVQGYDNSVYLHQTFEGKKNASGAIFMDAIHAEDFTDRNTFIYGHNMKNGSMFGQLRKYKNADFCAEHPFFYIYTPDGKELTYQIFAVGVVEDTAESYKNVYVDDNEFLQYIDYIRKVSRFKSDVKVTAESKIVSLSTCTNVTETQRMLVHGVKISEKMVGE